MGEKQSRPVNLAGDQESGRQRSGRRQIVGSEAAAWRSAVLSMVAVLGACGCNPGRGRPGPRIRRPRMMRPPRPRHRGNRHRTRRLRNRPAPPRP